MTVNPAFVTATFDPLSNGILVGSGPWECKSSTGVLGAGCSSNGTGSPPYPGGSFSLTRFGAGLAPASTPSGIYFRSAGNLALWIWAGPGSAGPGIVALASLLLCFGQPVNPSGPCAHWQHGIGASSTGVVGANQVSIESRYFRFNWVAGVAPYNWVTSPPLGIGLPFPPILYEGSVTLNPCSIDPVNGYDC
jgi:hypothetical protein